MYLPTYIHTHICTHTHPITYTYKFLRTYLNIGFLFLVVCMMWTGSKSAGPSHITECEYRDNNAKKNIQRANIILLRESERRRECKVYTCLVYLKLILIKSYLTNKKMREHISGSHIPKTSPIIGPHYSSVNDLFHNKFKSCLYSICLCHFLSK